MQPNLILCLCIYMTRLQVFMYILHLCTATVILYGMYYKCMCYIVVQFSVWRFSPQASIEKRLFAQSVYSSQEIEINT